MGGCTGLEKIDLGPFLGISELCGCFLAGCSALVTIDLSPLSHLETLPEGFLSECSGLIAVDLSKFSKINHIPSGFLTGCTSLKAIRWPEDAAAQLKNTSTVGSNTTNTPPTTTTATTTAESVMTNTKKMQSIPRDFLSECTGLETIDLSAFSELNEIPSGFLRNCSGLKYLDLRPIRHPIQKGGVPPMFLSGCSGLVATIPTQSVDGTLRPWGPITKATQQQRHIPPSNSSKCIIA